MTKKWLVGICMAALIFTTFIGVSSAGSALTVSAIAEDTIAAPGNTRSNYIVVSVVRDDGSPVTGLQAANFKVDPIIVAPGGTLVTISTVIPGRLPGFYIIQVIPNSQTWKNGVYIFAVAIESAGYRGQTLASVTMD